MDFRLAVREAILASHRVVLDLQAGNARGPCVCADGGCRNAVGRRHDPLRGRRDGWACWRGDSGDARPTRNWCSLPRTKESEVRFAVNFGMTGDDFGNTLQSARRRFRNAIFGSQPSAKSSPWNAPKALLDTRQEQPLTPLGKALQKAN
jgi:hypothetical protein